MTEPVKSRGGRKPLLRPDPETLERLGQFALRGATKRATALAFGVCEETFRRFVTEVAAAKKVWDDGQAECKQLRLAAAGKSLVAAEPPAQPASGEACPTCGQTVGGPQSVNLTPAEITHAAREFDAILDRYLAAPAAQRRARRSR